jgi:hypothetical protein
MPNYFDRYDEFKSENKVKPVPGIKLPVSPSDKKVVYKRGKTRMDKLSQEYYGSPHYSWLIMLCNQKFGGLEFDIPNNEIITIPFPLNDALGRYVKEVKEHQKLNGEE